jgi:alpha-L-fucosidase
MKCCGVTWDNSWDFPDPAEKDYSICFENKIMPQVEEILTGYGDLCLIWFDVPTTLTREQSRTLYDLVKQYQPDALINSRLGNGVYDYVSLGDNEVPETFPEHVNYPRLKSRACENESGVD